MSNEFKEYDRGSLDNSTHVVHTDELENIVRGLQPQGDVIITPDYEEAAGLFDPEAETVIEAERPLRPSRSVEPVYYVQQTAQPRPRAEQSENAKRIVAEKAAERQQKKRRKRTVTAIIVVAVLIMGLLIASAAVRNSAKNKSYTEAFNTAQNFYYAGEYDEALDALRHVMQVKKTDECLLLMSACYEAKEDYVNAIAILESSNTGSGAVADRLERLKSTKEKQDEKKIVTIAGEDYESDITTLDLSGKRLRSEKISGIANLTELTTLKLNNNHITTLSFLVPLKNLVSLDLSDNSIEDIRSLYGMTNLRSLRLDNNKITDYTPLCSLTGLTTLSIVGMDISESQLTELKTALPACIVTSDEAKEDVVEIKLGGKTFMSDVKELDLNNCSLSDIYALSVCKSLTKLNISGNLISDLSPLMEMPELQSLDASGNRITDVRPLLSLTKLELLDLTDNEITSITALTDLKALTELYLSGNELKSFQPLAGLTELKYLGLQDTGINDEGLKQLYDLKKLKTVALEDNKALSQEGVDELQKKLPDCRITHSELTEYLSIGGVKIEKTAESAQLANLGITDISELSKLTNVKYIDLSGNKIVDFSPLYGLSTLTDLFIQGNPFSPEELSALESALPNCTVHAN